MSGGTIQQRAAEIAAEFGALGDWLDRYRYIIALGQRMPGLPGELRSDAHRLPGCQYALWLACDYDASAGVLRFRADSDAGITRGLAALILRVLDGEPPAAVAGADLSFLDRTGLRAQLSSQRGAGLDAMIAEIKRRARAFADGTGS